MRRAGFTLVELMIATLIFSMVIAGFAAIYTTAFSQSGAVLRDARLKSTAMISLKDMTNVLARATRIVQPAIDGSENAVTGCANMAPDATRNTTLQPITGFGFCVQPAALGQCDSPVPPSTGQPELSHPAPCLFKYTWNSCGPPPVLSGGNCGDALSGATPELLAWRVLLPAVAPPDNNCTPSGAAYFTRVTATAVGIKMRLCRNGRGQSPVQWYDVSTFASGQFDPRL